MERDCLPVGITCSEQYFDEAVRLICKYWWLINFKWTDIFTNDVIGNIPQEWCEYLMSLDAASVRDMMCQMQAADQAPKSLHDFIDACKRLSLRLHWTKHNVDIPEECKEKRYSVKKVRESINLAAFVADVCSQKYPNYAEDLMIVDIGCGLGYVSSNLNRKGFAVVGVDCRKELVETCNNRIKTSTMQFVRHRVDGTATSVQFLESLVPEGRKGVVLALHCCGDLLDHIISLFTKSDRFSSLFCVTCCYHLINANNFPRSRLLKQTCEKADLKLDHVSLRVGCQKTPCSWAENLSDESMQTYAISSAFRAILEEVLVQTDYKWKKPKCHMKKSQNFADYTDQVLPGFEPEVKEQAEDLLRIGITERKGETKRVMVLKILQTMIQPVMESLIVYDHIVKLRESGFTASGVQVFSQIISPRNTLIMSSKK